MRLTDTVAFAIDDEYRHIQDYDALGIPTIWVDLYDTGKDKPTLGGTCDQYDRVR
jgi:hypothetical protein